MKKLLFPAFILITSAFSAGCSNYTQETPTINPPVLTSIDKKRNNEFVLNIMANNTEIGFAGYRMYTGNTEKDAREAPAANGYECADSLANLPDRAIAYRIEVSPTRTQPSSESSNILCTITFTLTSGTWVAVRSLIYKDFLTKDTSMSSNALPVP